jgi:hypothetical protein
MISFNAASAVVFVFFAAAAAAPVHAAADVSVGLTSAAIADTSKTITGAVARDAARMAQRDEITGLMAARWEFAQRSTVTRLKKCQSKKKGTFIGAAVGGIAGAAVASYINREAGGILGTASGANTYLFYWTAAGAGGGALVGLVYCS